jgi:arylsulfatase A-like enzyme
VFVVLPVVVLAALVWTKPWAESLMTVTVTVAADKRAPVRVYRTRKPFSEKHKPYRTVTAEVDLSRWAGQLVQLDIAGEVTQRRASGSATGYVACEAELLTPNGEQPIEFTSWHQGAEIGAHTRPLGPLAYRLTTESEGRFAFAMKGSLWHCLKAPDSARVRVRLMPVPSAALEQPLVPYVSAQQEDRSSVQLPARRPDRPPDVFIYIIDALRPDHLGCYGYPRGTSPTIDAFAAEATVYENAYTAATWTRPSVATMLTGLYPSVHGAIHQSDGLAEWPVLLPEMLQGAGYRTHCFTTNPNLSAAFGLDQGYDQYIYCPATADWVTTMVSRSLAGADASRRVFTYIQTVEPHSPYTPRADLFARFDRGFRGRCDGIHDRHNCMGELQVTRPGLSEADVQHLLDLYDAEVYEADQAFGDFLAVLRKAGRYDDSLIILASDHGEAFAEHDTLFHDWSLNEETLRVPLIVHYPEGRRAGERVKQRASLLDLTPTILGQVGLRPDLPYRLQGRDLAGEAQATDPGGERRIYAEVSSWDNNEVDLVAVLDEDGYKRVIDVSVPPRERASQKSLGLWDLRSDPKEKVDLSQKLPVRAAYDEQLIAGWLLQQRYWRGGSAPARPPRVKYDEAIGKQLRALGYLGGKQQQHGDGR